MYSSTIIQYFVCTTKLLSPKVVAVHHHTISLLLYLKNDTFFIIYLGREQILLIVSIFLLCLLIFLLRWFYFLLSPANACITPGSILSSCSSAHVLPCHLAKSQTYEPHSVLEPWPWHLSCVLVLPVGPSHDSPPGPPTQHALSPTNYVHSKTGRHH